MVETMVTGKGKEDILKERSRTMPNMQTVRLVHDMIKDQFGTLDDLPKELSITIANLYYKFTANLLEMMGLPTGKKSIMPMAVKQRARDVGWLFGKVLSEEGQIVKDLQAAIENVKALRGGKDNKSESQDPTVELILNGLKNKHERLSIFNLTNAPQ